MNLHCKTVGFEKLKVKCFVGTLPHERLRAQEICISLKVKVKKAPPSFPDEISSTIDYSALAQLCVERALSGHHALLETLASSLIEEIFTHFPCAYGWIRIEKAEALPQAACAFVEWEKGEDL